MKELIYEKLDRIGDLEDRKMLKNIMEDVFLKLYDHSEEMYQHLQDRVFEEIEFVEGKYNIYTSIVAKSDLDPTHSFLYPMLEDDLQEQVFDLEVLLQTLIEEKKTFIFKVFFQCDYLIFNEILKENRTFKGTIRTDKKSYVAYFELEKEEVYKQQIEALYKIFIHNEIPWHTINAPYIYKIARVNLTGVEEQISSKENIEEIIIDFGEYAHYVKYDMVPLWNLKRLDVMGMGFAMPCENKLFYEHKISLKELGLEDGYLVVSEDIEGIRHTKEYLYITAPIEESVMWDICKITMPKELQLSGHHYPLMSNAKKANFIDKLEQRITYPIKTKAEILRLLNILEAATDIELAEIKLIDKTQLKISETYNLNSFIIDEIRDSTTSKILLLSFYEKGKTSYVSRDVLSFIVSEIQYYYPEYRCEGKLL